MCKHCIIENKSGSKTDKIHKEKGKGRDYVADDLIYYRKLVQFNTYCRLLV